jgi:hypothetical protein
MQTLSRCRGNRMVNTIPSQLTLQPQDETNEAMWVGGERDE